MKKLLLSLLFTSIILAQSGVGVYDPASAKQYDFILGIGIDQATGDFIWMNQRGERIAGIDLSQYFVKRTEYDTLKSAVDNLSYISSAHIRDPYQGVVLFYSETYSAFIAEPLDYVILQYSQVIKNLLIDRDTLFARIGRLGGTATTYSPTYAFYYDPVSFGTVYRTDTTLTNKYIKNTGTAVLSCSFNWTAINGGETEANPFSLNFSAPFLVSAGDSTQLQIKFNPTVQNYLYEWRCTVTHNGGVGGIIKTDSFNVSGNWINPTVTTAHYFVASSGNDNNAGTEASPFKTVAKGLSMLQKNQTLALNRGDTFAEQVVINKDSITIADYGTGLKPIVKYASVNTNPLVELYDRKQVIFKNIKFVGFNDIDYYQDLIEMINTCFVLFDSCDFVDGTHCNIVGLKNVSGVTHDIVAKNCTFYSTTHSNINIANGGYNLVLDGCFFKRAGTGSPTPFGDADGSGGFALYGMTNIKARRNIFQYSGISGYGKGGGAIDGRSRIDANGVDNNSINSYYVHNVFYKNFDAGITLGMVTDGTDYTPCMSYGGNRFFNNIFDSTSQQAAGRTNDQNRMVYYIMDVLNTMPPYTYPYPPANDIWKGNLSGNTDKDRVRYYGSGGSDYYFTNHTSETLLNNVTNITNNTWTSDNIVGDPKFVKPYDSASYSVNADFSLQGTSDAIDVGAFLTTVTSSNGTGTTFNVGDANFFFDGWGLTLGDSIQVGTDILRITSITGNAITVDQSFTWALGDSVSFPYNGTKPDIGAFED